MQIEGAVFLVTGGGSGLGAATARVISDRGGSVVICDVDEESGEKMANELGENVRFVKTDVTDEESVKNALEVACGVGILRGAVNCAGIGPAEKVVGKRGVHALESFEKAVSINLVGTFNVIRLSAEAMVANEPSESGECGVIVNTASVAAFDGQIGQAAYSASKGGVVGMTLPIARELASSGVRVMTIAPGIFETPMLAALPDAARESLGQQTPFPSRLGRPEEYAALVEHIFENEMLNGEVIRLDGAIRMAPR